MLDTIALVIFALTALFGLGLSALGIAGTFAILGGALLYNIITWSWTISPVLLAALAGLALIGEAMEWVITYLVNKKSGASTYALVGTIIGAILGAMALSIVPILGTLIGLVLGGLLGAYLAELWHTKNSARAWKAAKATLLARGIIMLTKLALAIAQVLIVLHAIQ